MSEESFEFLMGTGKLFQFKRKDLLLSEGAVSNKIFFIHTGHARTFYNKEGRHINLQFTFEGGFLTNISSLRSGNPSEYNIVAEEKLTGLYFDKTRLLELYQRSAEITNFGRSFLEHLFKVEEEHVNFLKIYTPAERYAILVKNQSPVIQRVPQTKLCSYLGISRETLSRIRTKM